MEEIVKDVINIGLGAADKVKALVGGDTSVLQGVDIEELKSQGAVNDSQAAVMIRQAVDQTMMQMQDVKGKVDTIVAEGQGKLSETLANLNLPAVSVDDLRSNFDMYAAQMQEQLNVAFDQIRPVLEQLNIDDLRTRVEEMIASMRNRGGGPAA